MARGDGTSGYKQSGPRYFPSHAPTWFSYTLDFAMGGSYYNHGMVKVGQIAEKKLSGSRIDYHKGIFDNPKVIEHLQALANAAESAELAFLNKYGITIPGKDWGGLIQAFNLLFSSQEAMEQNLRIIEQTLHKDLNIEDNTYHYFITHFSSNIQTAARKVVRNRVSANSTMEDFDAMLDEVIELALRQTFNQSTYVDSNGVIHTNDVKKEDKETMEVQQAYSSLQNQIDKFKNNPYFKQQIAELLGVDASFLKKTAKAQRYKKKQPAVKDGYRNGKIKGTIAEVFEYSFLDIATKQLVGQTSNGMMTLNWETIWSGDSGVKADVISHNVSIGKQLVNIDQLTTQAGENDSKRVNAINHYRAWFEKMKEARGEIVFVSDKNYQIKSGFRGFEAQGSVKLAHLAALLSATGSMGGTNIRNLIDYLANCGGDMLLTNSADKAVLDSIAAQIGNFLFDDLEITGATGINRIHLLNLSGIYLPLSVYFHGLIDAIQNTRTEVSNFVSVRFKPAGAGGAASPWQGEEDWRAFRETQLNNSTIDVHFMRNFAQFITSQVRF